MRLKRVHSGVASYFFPHCFWKTLISNHPEIPHSVHQSALSHHSAKTPSTSPPPPTPRALSSIELQLLQTQLHQAEALVVPQQRVWSN